MGEIIKNHETRINRLEKGFTTIISDIGEIKKDVGFISGRFKEADNRKLEKAIIKSSSSIKEKMRTHGRNAILISVVTGLIEVFRELIQ